jgi:hypothetical protein
MSRRGGTWPSLVKALVWGTREQEFKSPRPDYSSNTELKCRCPVLPCRYGPAFEIRTYMVRFPVEGSSRGVRKLAPCDAGARLNANSAGAIRIVRRDVVRLGLDTSHFRGKRAWSDAQLRRAVMDAQSWDELLTTLGLALRSGDGRIRVKAHAMRLGLDLAHLENPIANSPSLITVKPELRYLRDAGNSIAASWFSLCGFSVALPVEPAVYDLLVAMPDGIKRVQVKTTTCYGKDGWTVVVGRRPYSVGNRES